MNSYPPQLALLRLQVPQKGNLDWKHSCFSSHVPLKAANFSVILKSVHIYRLFIQSCIQKSGKKIPRKTYAFVFNELHCFRSTACFFRKMNLLTFVTRLKYLEMLKRWNKKLSLCCFPIWSFVSYVTLRDHEKFLWIIYKHLGRKQLLLLHKKMG